MKDIPRKQTNNFEANFKKLSSLKYALDNL